MLSICFFMNKLKFLLKVLEKWPETASSKVFGFQSKFQIHFPMSVWYSFEIKITILKQLIANKFIIQIYLLHAYLKGIEVMNN